MAISKNTENNRPPSLLIIGPTGSGKTPLGERSASSGLWNRRCLHFDFGAHLRKAGSNRSARMGLTENEYEVINRVLSEGFLLYGSEFSIAEKILTSFINTNDAVDKDTVLILNGLPRHIGQAEAVNRLVDIRAVLELRCPASVVSARIRKNTGGDRIGRNDDTNADIENKLEVYVKRTKPLVEYYLRKGELYMFIDVTSDMNSKSMLAWLESQDQAEYLF
jgi:adenylate kinase